LFKLKIIINLNKLTQQAEVYWRGGWVG